MRFIFNFFIKCFLCSLITAQQDQWCMTDINQRFTLLQVVTALALVFSVMYVVWYRSDKPHHRAVGTSTIAVLGKIRDLETASHLLFLLQASLSL